MVSQIAYIPESSFEPPRGVFWHGVHPNTMPYPFSEISDAEFWHLMGQGTNACEFRQVDYMNRMRSVHIWWLHNCGIACMPPRNWTLRGTEVVWTEPPLYFRIGCDHKFRELSIEECGERNLYHAGRCWHVSECMKCRHIESHDSSD